MVKGTVCGSEGGEGVINGTNWLGCNEKREKKGQIMLYGDM